ncbi:uncharacterized protein [Amphiura filiformis]|uniref:uncharacterized protein n=1 Tax=Amphiura filiformis TaxID=82378 RepID=UPI003B216CAC
MVRAYHTLFFIVLAIWICNSVRVTQGQNANTTQPRQGKLVWTELNTNTKRARINSLPVDPASYIDAPTIATTGYYEATPAHWIAITSDYDDSSIFWTDAARKRIMRGGLGDGATAAPVFTGTSQTVDGIAVDWLANNIYWTDGAYDWIMLTNYNGSRFKMLIDEQVDKPRGITVYPQQGYLYWSDWGDHQRVERSNLAGENRTLIADTDLFYPNGLAIDYATDKLYWVDADPSGSRVEVCDLDGSNRTTLFTIDQGLGHLFDLAIFGEYIFVTDWREQMRCLRKSNKDQYFALNVGARPFGITVYAPDNLPGSQSPCDSNPCEHFCVSDGPDEPGFKCLCNDTYVLKDDKRTCEQEIDGLPMPQILMVSKTSLCNFPGNFPDMSVATDQTVKCFLSNRSFAVAIEVDIPSRLLFYSDFEKKTIERVRLLQGESVDTIRGGVGSVEGLAVDWLTENIYWTDAMYHHIAVSRYDGQHRKIIVKDNIIKPRSIVIHASMRLMFWTEFGPPGHIEKSGLDGRNREIIVSGLTSPNGLTIDFEANRLYFSDRQSGSVESIDFDGGNKRDLYTRIGAQYFDMDIYKDYLIWTEWNTFNGIHAMNRENGRVTQSLRVVTPVYGIKAYAAERQPIGASVCGTDNGGCNHLCLPKMNTGYRCECGTGYTLASDGRTCETSKYNGGCNHLCLPKMNTGYRCECGTGYTLASDGRTCQTSKYNGGCNHLCLPKMNTGYRCECGTGYTLASDGRTCETSKYNGGCNHLCLPKMNTGFRCECGTGYTLASDGRTCETSKYNGGCNHLCLPKMNTGYRCECGTGYTLASDGRTCETSKYNGGCNHLCLPKMNTGYRCECGTGYTLASDGRTCETSKYNGGCNHLCLPKMNTGYRCECGTGYTLASDGRTCETSKYNGGCNHLCLPKMNTGYRCECGTGYTLASDGRTCETSKYNGGCNHLCLPKMNTGYRCECGTGYTLASDGRTCETSKYNGGCNHLCLPKMNTGYRCECGTGYTLASDGRTCETSKYNGGCNHLCLPKMNTGYRCECGTGYTLASDGRTCQTSKYNGGCNHLCLPKMNTGYRCECGTGYTLASDGRTCETSKYNGGCNHLCLPKMNTGFRCECGTGYTLASDGRTCETSKYNGGCNHLCLPKMNTGYRCECGTGYTLASDGRTCETSKYNGGCNHLCLPKMNTGYRCECGTGYTLASDGRTCETSKYNGGCNHLCLPKMNTGYRCECGTGYTLASDGRTCETSKYNGGCNHLCLPKMNTGYRCECGTGYTLASDGRTCETSKYNGGCNHLCLPKMNTGFRCECGTGYTLASDGRTCETSKYNGGCNHLCLPKMNTGYRCECGTGYTLASDGRTCQTSKYNGGCNHLCLPKMNTGYRCECGTGYTLASDGRTCETSKYNGGCNHLCLPKMNTGYRCECGTGYTLASDGRTCETSKYNGGCNHLCLPKMNTGYRCECGTGYTLASDGRTCETSKYNGGCNHLCLPKMNTGYRCECGTGYTLASDGRTCQTSKYNGGCNHLCLPKMNTGYRCECGTGYTLASDGRTCETSKYNGGCNHLCLPKMNTGYRCECGTGYTLASDGRTCETSKYNGGCNHLCLPKMNTGYRCECGTGYTLASDGRTCETSKYNGGCNHLCLPKMNTGYRCECGTGYTLASDGRTCQTSKYNGGCNHLCLPKMNTGYRCECGTGYTLASDGRTCETSKYNGGCNHLCLPKMNTGYRCECGTGYTLASDGRTCETSKYNGGCNHLCLPKMNTGYRCECGTGYTLASDGRTCQTSKYNGGCNHLCLPKMNTGYRCECGTGYTLASDGRTCETSKYNGGCNHLCLPKMNTGYRCECGTGYTLASDGHTCETSKYNGGCNHLCLPKMNTGYRCECGTGYTLASDGRTSQTSKYNGGCNHLCLPKMNTGYRCECGTGYTLASDGRTCQTSKYNGGCNHLCLPKMNTGYRCECGTGYTLASDGRTCETSKYNGGCNHLCLPKMNTGYRCECGTGYTLASDGRTCETSKYNGGCNHLCLPKMNTGYRCECGTGYTLASDGHTCETSKYNGGCNHLCLPKMNTGYRCECGTGYTLASDGRTCQTSKYNGGCNHLCLPKMNTGFRCECGTGYTLASDGRTCETSKYNGGCNHLCLPKMNTGYRCECGTGYTLASDGRTCETSKYNGGCNHLCLPKMNTGYRCECGTGYTLASDGRTCETSKYNGGCNHLCLPKMNTGYRCECGTGYTLASDGRTCETSKYNGGCNHLCLPKMNTGYRCECGTGYTLASDGRTCQTSKYNGGCNHLCLPKMNTGYRCECGTGYTLASDGRTCETSKYNGGCNHLCLPKMNTGYRCECGTGYTLASDGRTCETSKYNGGCNHLCLPKMNTGYRCECGTGYTLASDGHTCQTSKYNGGCNHLCQPKMNTGYRCECGTGYTLASDGRTCQTSKYNGGCNHLCLPKMNTGYRCECGTGYTLASDGRTCETSKYNGGCNHLCLPKMNTGFRCECGTGYTLASDGRTWETSKYNGDCNHLCLPKMNTGYRCECGTGYTLASDGHTCETNIASDGFLLATDSFLHGIVQMFIDDARLDYTSLDLGPMTNPIAVDYDPIEDRVYWSDVKEQKIYRAFMNGTGREAITGPGFGIRVDGLAIDRVSRLIYWTDADSNTTSVARLDGSKRKTLIIDNLDQPRAIALDIANGYLYWSDWGDNARIERAFMNGTNRQTLVDSGLGWPNGIALDLTENYIYWCDALTNKIERSGLTGENRTTVIDFGDPGFTVHPFGIAVHGSYLYWTDWKQRSLLRANKADGSRNQTIGPQDFVRLNSIRIYSASEDITTTVCSPDNGGCSSLCLPTPDGAVCACQDGDSLSPDGKTCWGDMSCPRVIPHGNISSQCGMDGACNIVCDEGYSTEAVSMTAKCQASGDWDIDTTFLCQEVTCEPLPIPLDATAHPCSSPHVYGTTCVFHCDRGWERESGDEQRTCQADETWSGTELVCQRVTCDPLEPPEYGYYSNSNCSTVGGYYNDLCTAQCQEGFQLLGITERGCLATGEWTDADDNSTCIDLTLPVFNSTCIDVDVTAARGQVRANVSYPTPVATDNSGKPVNIWSRRTEYLSPPIEMDEGEYIMTFYAQDWVHNTAGCTFVITVHVIRCDDLEDPEFGYFDNCQTHYGASCTVTCHQGYHLKGDEVRTCELDDTGKPYWTGNEVPTCQVTECEEAEVGSHVVKAGCTPPYTYNTECIYMCQPGYVRRRGSSKRECQPDSTWDGNPLECEIQHCGTLSPFEHGTIEPAACISSGGDYGSVCNVTCKDGYRLVGAHEHRCLETGRWSNSAEDSHYCIDITEPHFNDTCPPDFTVYAQWDEQDAEVTWTLHIVDNSQVNVTSTRESGSRFAEGIHTIVVTAIDAAGNVGTCEFIVTVKVLHCPELRTIPSMVAGCDTTHYGSQCSFACQTGYKLIGNANLTCNGDPQGDTMGQWSSSQPRCKVVTCPKLNDVLSGLPWKVRNSRRCTTNRPARYNNRCDLVCQKGYNDNSGIFPMYAQCGQNGEWNLPSNGTCTVATCDPVLVDVQLIQTPAGCLNERGNFNDACQLTCPDGYRHIGPEVYYCNMENVWRTKGPMPDLPFGIRPGRWPSWPPRFALGTEVSDNENRCEDIMEPVFDGPCPRETTLTVAPCQNYTTVNITKPTATDNSGNVTVLGQESSVRELPNGMHTFLYVASDAAGNWASCNVTININLVTCNSRIPQQDDVASLSCDTQYGSVVTYTCPEGQKPMDTNQPMTCGSDGEWTGQVPGCEDITCDMLEPPSHGRINPPKCSQVAMTVGSSCFVICDNGYGYKGESKHACRSDGTWSRDVGSCVDIQPPVFTSCPSGIEVTLQPGQNQTTFNWQTPVATDNSGEEPVIKNAERVVPPLTLEPGYRIIQYVATDSVGNSDYCIFTVTVRDAEPPKVKMCPQPKVISVSSIPVEATWIEPMFTDNIAVTKVSSDDKPGIKLYSWGRHTVTYRAQDAAGNQARCVVFMDVVDSTSCKPLKPPANGALACENDNLCTVHCNSGYMFTDKSKPQSAYSCSENGFWNFGDDMEREPNLPACSQVTQTNPVNWQRRDKVQFELHHLNGNCQDVEKQIQDKFQQLLRSSAFMDYCRQDPNNNCKVDNVIVQCGDTGKVGRRRRQTDEGQQQDELLSLIYNLFGQRNNSEEIDALLTAMNMSISDLIGDTNITLTIDGEQVTLSSQGGESGDIQVICQANQTLADNGLTCVDCPLGTRYSFTIADCNACPKGKYQDETGQRSCKYCPPNTSTASQAATGSSLCIPMCIPGEYSPSGLQPCQRCPKGTHQKKRGEKGCTPCPDNMTTRTTGATTLQQCIAESRVVTEPVDVNPIRTTIPPVQSQSTLTNTKSTGKIDISASTSSVVITKVSNPNKGPDILTSQATPRAQENKSSQKAGLSLTVIIAAAAGGFICLILVGICVVVIMRRNRHRVPYGARPLSWAGSEGADIMSEDEEEDGEHHASGYHQLEESSPDFTEAKVGGDKRYYAANAISNPAYEPTFSTFKDNTKDVPDGEDGFDDTFHIFSPSGPLDSVNLN